MKKNSCILCLSVKGRRVCKITQGSLICPKCCAEKRNSDCGGCSYYAQAEKFTQEKMKKATPGQKHFTARIDPEVDKAVDQAMLWIEKGNIKKSQQMLLGLLEKHPDLFMVQYGMGAVMAAQKEYQKSLVFFDKCIDIYPYLIEAWFNKGLSHMNLFDIGAAATSFQKVIELEDSNEEVARSARKLLGDLKEMIYQNDGISMEAYIQSEEMFNQAFMALKEKKYEHAIAGFKNVLKLKKNSVQSHGNLGLCYAFLGKRKEALSSFDRALELDPQYEPARKNRDIFLSLGEGETITDAHFKVTHFYKEKAERGSAAG